MYEEKSDVSNIRLVYERFFPADKDTARAIAGFFDAEVKLFDKSLDGLVDQYPLLADRIKDVHLKLYLPVKTNIEFLNNQLQVFKLMQTDRRRVFARLKNYAKQGGYEERLNDIIETLRKQTENWERMIRDASENLPSYVKFALRLMQAISEQRTEPMDDIGKRNEVYRQVLTQESAWLLGYDLRVVCRMSKQVADENQCRAKLYQQLDEETKQLVRSRNFAMIFPQPLEIDSIDGRTLHEEILPKIDDPQMYEDFEKAVNAHFDRRRKEIFGKH